MGKVDQIQQGRNDGLRYALQIIDNAGGDVQALRDEVKRRGITGVGIRATHAELDKACEAIKVQAMDCVLLMSLCVLRDQYGFGTKRLNRFKANFSEKTECLLDDHVTWAELLETLKEETNIEQHIRYNDKDTKLFNDARKQG